MSPSAIVQKLPPASSDAQVNWNYCNVMPASLRSAHVNLPACRLPVFQQTGALLGVYLCLAGRQAGRRDDRMSYGGKKIESVSHMADGLWEERDSMVGSGVS
jgi:hypothetical protein